MFKLTAFTTVTVLIALLGGSAVDATQIVYDDGLCTSTRSTLTVSCSTGANGLFTRGFTTFAALPGFPAVGGFPGVGFNSTNCGACFEVSFPGTGRAINFTAVNEGGPNQAVLCTSEFLRLTGYTRDNVPNKVAVAHADVLNLQNENTLDLS
ncbi:hypothetical protein MD484_g2462, partial [Candolleomyces efflorescens]